MKLNLSIGGSGKEAGPHYDVRINQSMYLKMKFSRHFNFFFVANNETPKLSEKMREKGNYKWELPGSRVLPPVDLSQDIV